MYKPIVWCGVAAACIAMASTSRAQDTVLPQVAANQSGDATAAQPSAPVADDHLMLYFDAGSTAVRAKDRPLLDKAARLYRDAHPVIMIISGGADSVGTALPNLLISSGRAQAVLRELVARGIPAEHFQVLAKGLTDQAVSDPQGVAEPANRSVEIRWR